MHTFTSIYVMSYKHKHTYFFICIHTRTHIQTDTDTCTQTYAHRHTHTDTPMHTDTRPGQIRMLMYLGNGCHGSNFNIAIVINLQVSIHLCT